MLTALPYFDERSIYLHFLNRELLRAVQVAIPERRAEELLCTVLFSTTAPVYAPHSYLFESALLGSNRSRFIQSILEADLIEVVSRFPTGEGQVANSQRMYSHEPERYPMYFANIDPFILRIRPQVLKDMNTTAVLDADLRSLLSSPAYSSTHQMPPADLEILDPLRPRIMELIRSREEQALTFSFFEQELKGKAIENGLVLARFLTMSRLRHYLSFLGAEIPTGIRGLEYFDRIARRQPRHHIPLIETILGLIGAKISWCVYHVAPYIAESHGSSEHAVFVSYLSTLLMGTEWVYQRERAGRARYGAAKELRALISEATDRPEVEPRHFFKTASVRLGNMIIAAEANPHFAEYMAFLQSRAPMNLSRVVLLTATDLEGRIMLSAGERETGIKAERIPIGDQTVHNLGNLGGVDIFMVQSEMGTELPGSMTLTAIDTIRNLRPKFVFLVGIAYGLMPNEQKIGDILVSRQLQVCDVRKVTTGPSGERINIQRGDRPSAPQRIADRVRSEMYSWTRCRVHRGLLLSMNTLVNFRPFVEELRQTWPDAIGGEMEGAGVYASSMKEKVDWIVIKGISDWGYDKRDEDQEPAAANAIDFTWQVIKSGSLKA